MSDVLDEDRNSQARRKPHLMAKSLKGLLLFSLALLASNASAGAAEKFPDLTLADAKQIVSQESDANGQTRYYLNLDLLDRKIDAVAYRAGSYPPTFQDDGERTQTLRLLRYLMDVVRIVKTRFEMDGDMAKRAARIYWMACNLDIPVVTQQVTNAKHYYELALKHNPKDAEASWLYGAFLCSVSECEAGKAYLEQAVAMGLVAAQYDLALAILPDDQARARSLLQEYCVQYPADERAAKVLEALEHGLVIREPHVE